ncbi:MAG: acetyl-CoA acetyltransferase [Caulobacter sp.]|nr:acetyl-CoA acetyltransferase [Caulobacter sp.]
MTVSDRTPVLIGVGEASERIDAADYEGIGPAELAGRAARAALADTGAPDQAALAAAIDVIAAIRQFEISGPTAKQPFGCADNLPRAVGRRIGADPANAILEVVGGQGPQHLVNEMAHRIAAGEVEMALLAGAEAISTVRHLTSREATRDWSEAVGGQMEDRGYGLEGLITGELIRHGLRTPIQIYALFENARRARLGLDRDAYGHAMGELFAPFTQVAAGNPHAMSREVFTADELATVTPKNRLTADPFPRRMVARDQANQGAAVLLTSVGKARALGVPQDRWVYLHGGADVKERTVIERPDLSQAPGALAATQQALKVARKAVADMAAFDLYSCFPIAVFNIRDGLGIGADDPRPLTVTGGLPFFGGAGNNYSMHAIASMVRALRAEPGAFGLVGANGGFLSKYSVGVYSTKPAVFAPFSSQALQADVDGVAAPPVAETVSGEGVVETYTIDYGGPAPKGLVIGRTAGGERFVAYSDDPARVEAMIANDPLGATIQVGADDKGRNVIIG